MNKHKDRFRPYLLTLALVLVGGLLGYLYYLKIGCVTGSCRITSNPLFSTLYGALFGYLIATLMPKPKKTSEAPAEDGDE